MGLIAAMAPAATLYVSPTGGNSPPYNAWTNAATSVRTAVLAANNSDTVLITNGNYAETAEIVIGKSVTVRSVNGPSVTTVRRSGAGTFRVFSMTNALAFLAGVTITNGSNAGNEGAGLYMKGGTASNCVIAYCSGDRGSPVYMNGGLLTHSVIRNNRDTGNSGGCGGVRMLNTAIMQFCRLTANRPGSEAGGAIAIYMQGGATVDRCFITNNLAYSATVVGNTIRMQAGDTVRNCVIARNTGRGITMSGGSVENCTVTRNTVYGSSGNGINQSGGSVQNSIVYHNGTAPYVQQAGDFAQSGGTALNTCMGVLLSGSGNTAQPPRFTDLMADVYTLRPGSPCIDTATILGGVATDIAGTARPIDGNGDAGIEPDMGAYEAPAANAGTFRCGFRASKTEAVGLVNATLTPYVAGPTTTITRARWSFGDGAVSNRTDLSAVSHAFGPGIYTISLTLSNSIGETATAVMTNDIRVGPVQGYVSPIGSHTFPFDTWAKAATSIQPAIDALLITNGEVRTVTVTNGSYGVTAEVTLDRPVRLRSVNGPSTTLIRRTSGTIRLARLAHADAWISGFTVTNGSNAGADGAGIYVSAGTVSNCVITHCTGDRGSSLYMTGAGSKTTHSVIRNCTDTGNSGGSGGVRMGSGAVLQYCTLTRNRPGSEDNGVMAIYMTGNSTVLNCAITNCTAYSGTKASVVIRMQAGDTVRNCLVADNPGRGIHVTGGTVENCTVTRNSIYGDTGNGMLESAGLVQNCIVWANGSDNSKNLSKSGGTFIYSDVYPAETGSGNRSSDPSFLGPTTGNFRLDPGSPLINTGTNLGWMASAVDLAGSNRLQAATVDMGCFEAMDPALGPLTCNFDVPSTEGVGNLEAVFTASSSGLHSNLVYYRWSFGDTHVQQGPALRIATNLYAAPGYYTVSLTVSNGWAETAVRSKTNFIYVAPLTAYVSLAGSNIAPYETWAKAATSIQPAIDIARVLGTNRTLVLVSNGVYLTGAQVEILKGIEVRSVLGHSATLIRRSTGGQRIAWLNHINAVLDGFTLTNGAVSGVLLNAGTLRNCLVVGSHGDRYAGGLYMTGGLASNCVFSGNWDTGNWNGCGGVVVGGGVLTHCVILRNTGGSSIYDIGGLRLTGGEVRHSIIASNLSGTVAGTPIGGVGQTGGTLRNCLLIGNQCGTNGLVGGLHLDGGIAESCTISGNRGGTAGGGLYRATAGSVTNCVIWGNQRAGGIASNVTGALSEFWNSCAPELTNGMNGNLAVDPQFQDAGSGAGLTLVAGDYQLKITSPCMNRGIYKPWMASATDLAGNRRIRRNVVDIGAYENAPSTGFLLILR